MPNAWMDADKARTWSPTGKPGQVLREACVEVLFTLLDAQAPHHIVDLGCGIGDLAARLLARYPEAHVTAIDASPGMLERTREAVAPFEDRVTVIQAELESDWHRDVADGVDAVMASQVVHHLLAAEKRGLFDRVHALLTPGGLFLMADRLRFDGAFWRHHVALWDRLYAEHGFEPFGGEMGYEAYRTLEAQGGDVPDTLADQLAWLGEAGFAAAECFWLRGDKAVFGGIKAGAPTDDTVR